MLGPGSSSSPTDTTVEPARRGGRIRVLQVLEATTGGTRRHVYYLLKYLDRARFDVTLVYSNERDPHFVDDLALFSTWGVHLIEIPMRREISPWHDAVAFIRILTVMLRGRYDVVHAHSSKAGFLARVAARIAGVRAIIYTPHGFAFQYRPRSFAAVCYRWLERLAALFHHRLMCVSEGERALALRHSITPASKICMIPNAIPADAIATFRSPESVRQSLGLPPGALVVGMVAHFRPQKGYNHFIDAIPAILADCPETRFLVIGGGPLLESARDRIRGLGVEESVILAGYQRHPPDFLQIMDLFVLSSLWEGMPYALLEAMAMGLPVVATDTAGNNELVEHGRNGLLVAPESASAIAASVVRILRDPTLRRAMGEAGRAMASARLDMSEWIERIERLYASAAVVARRA